MLTSLPGWSVLVSHWTRCVTNPYADFPRTRSPTSCLLGHAQRAHEKCFDRLTRCTEKAFKVAHMAKQSSLFSFFTKSPPLVSKSKLKPSPSPTEADLPSVATSNSSPKEQAKETPKQKKAKTQSVTPKNNPKPAKLGFSKPFSDKAPAAKQK